MTSFMTLISPLLSSGLFIVIKNVCSLSHRSVRLRDALTTNKLLSNLNGHSKILTDNTQMNEMAHVWRRRYLTPKRKKLFFMSLLVRDTRRVAENFYLLVDARISVLRIFNLKYPIFRVRVVDRFEALVRCVPNWISWIRWTRVPWALLFTYVYLPTVNRWISRCLTQDTCRSIWRRPERKAWKKEGKFN